MNRRFNFVSENGDGMGFAERLVREGEEVRMWIRQKDGASIGDGIVPKVGDLEDLVHTAQPKKDIFIFDATGNGIVADYLVKSKFHVLGDSLIADRLERDRSLGYEAMQDAGIKVPKSKGFDNFDDGIRYAKTHKQKLVYKPSKHLGDLSCSHVTEDGEELVELLENIRKEAEIQDPEFELQEFVEGVAVSSEGWFDGEQFIEPLFNHTLERKELMDGNIGPSGGCTGNIVWPCGDCRICKKGIHKMEAFLREQNYVGMLDLNAIVTEDGDIYGLEWTPRFGYDATPTFLTESVVGSLGDFFSATTGFSSESGVDIRDGYSGAVRITIPPWPTEKYLAQENVPIRGLDEEGALKSAYLYNLKRTDKLRTAGAWGILLLLTGFGNNINSAFKRPYDMADTVKIPNKQYRTDLVAEFTKDFDKLKGVA